MKKAVITLIILSVAAILGARAVRACTLTTAGAYDWHLSYAGAVSGANPMVGFVAGDDVDTAGCFQERPPAVANAALETIDDVTTLVIHARFAASCDAQELTFEFPVESPVGGLLAGTYEAENGFSSTASATFGECVGPLVQ